MALHPMNTNRSALVKAFGMVSDFKFGEELEVAWFNKYVDRGIAIVFLIDLAEVQELTERGSLLPLRRAT
jgi:hypothetical protein